MTFTLILSLIGIAVFDSINPSLFFGQFYLLTTPKPTGRITAYIAGIITVNFLGGLLLLSGARAVIGTAVASIPPLVGYGVLGLIGAGLLIYGLRYQPKPPAENGAKPKSLSPYATYIFGMVVMINELTTALPYFAAIERIASSQMTVVENLLALVLYNVVFSLPLFGFLALFLSNQTRFARQVETVSAWVQKWLPIITKYALTFIGLGLLAHAGWYFVTGDGLF